MKSVGLTIFFLGYEKSQVIPILLELRGLKNAEVTESSPVLSVQGRINARKNWWFENLQLSALVIGVLLTIYIIPFTIIPPPCFIKNNKSALDHAEFAANAINELVINRCAIEVFSRPYCCNPLSVARGRSYVWFRISVDLLILLYASLNLNMKASPLSQSWLETIFGSLLLISSPVITTWILTTTVGNI